MHCVHGRTPRLRHAALRTRMPVLNMPPHIQGLWDARLPRRSSQHGALSHMPRHSDIGNALVLLNTLKVERIAALATHRRNYLYSKPAENLNAQDYFHTLAARKRLCCASESARLYKTDLGLKIHDRTLFGLLGLESLKSATY